jgi:hypothetical protein
VFLWYILHGFGIMYQEKSGTPAYHFSQEDKQFRIKQTPFVITKCKRGWGKKGLA